MSDPRPALAEVVAALTAREDEPDLTEFWRVSLRDFAPPTRLRNVVCVTAEGVSTEHRATIDGRDSSVHVRGVALQPWTVASVSDALEILAGRDLWPWEPHGEDAARWWRDPPVREGQFVALAGDSTTVRVAHQGDRVVGQVLSVSGDTAHVVYQGNVATGAYSAMTLRRNPTDWSHAPPSIADLVAVASLGCERLRLIVDLAHELEHKAAVVWKVVARCDPAVAAERVGAFVDAGGNISQAAMRDLLNIAGRADGTLKSLVTYARISASREEWRRDAVPLGIGSSVDAVYDLVTACGVEPLEATPDRVVIGVEAVS